MARPDDTELVDRFEEFYRNYYRNEIADLAQKYPSEQKSLYIDWRELSRFDTDLADDFRNKPTQLRRYAEEALRLYDLPVDVSLGQAHVRVTGLPETTDIRAIRSDHRGTLIAVQGIVRKATDVRPKVTTAAFECQRCGTLTRIPQDSGDFQEPHECQGCERQGPFQINYDQSEFIDAQKLRVQESPEGLRGGETPQSIDINIEDDITGAVTPGDHVRVTGVLKLEQQGGQREKSPMFDVYMDGMTVEIEDEEFDEMDITDEDKKKIIELSNDPDIYEQIQGAIAPSIYGYETEKLAMAMQLFSGVTKFLPDGSRTRGDLHMLLIGDPGTGKCISPEQQIRTYDGSREQIGDFVERHMNDPVPVEDGFYADIDIPVPTVQGDGTLIKGRATKVWKREVPEEMYRIHTAGGRELEVTPSHPLFVEEDGRLSPVVAEKLSEGEEIASVEHAGSTRSDDEHRLQTAGATVEGRRAVQQVPGRRTLAWDRIETVEIVDPDYDWVYDLEVAGTHNYISEGVVSHNSAMLQYVDNIAPRSVYTSGKGATSAGLCVTGDTLVHTADGFREIQSLVTSEIPDEVDAETSVEHECPLYTYDRTGGELDVRDSSHVWRMPEKPCHRIETDHGKNLEASVNTPVLTCSDGGIEWKRIADVRQGDHVAVPAYDRVEGGVERSPVDVREYLELTDEKVKLAESSLEAVREELRVRFGTLRDGAAALELSEDFIYDSLSNRHVPLEKLDRILESIGYSRGDVAFERVMLRHGDSITLPEQFDAELMYLLGLVFGDGDISLNRRDGNRGCVRLSSSNETVLERAASIVAEKFDKHVEIEYQDERVPCIRIYSATIARLFANAGMESPKEDLSLAPELTTAEHADAFLRGLMDADGAVSSRENGSSTIVFSTISESLARQVQLMLETFGVRGRTRERDRRGTYELDSGYVIESKQVQQFLEIYGADIDRYAEVIGFGVTDKQEQLQQIVGSAERQPRRLPVGNALTAVEATAGAHYTTISRGYNPSREQAAGMLESLDLGSVEPLVSEAVEADLHWEEVVASLNTGRKEVFDLTVPGTHNFVGNGVVTHNTAAAVRDDFGDGQQWTLEAGALVLADKGVAAVDELDKMRCVTGDTLVHTAAGVRRIRELAFDAADEGTVEDHENGRTIRDIDHAVWTMTADGRLTVRDVTAVHEYSAPSELRTVTLESGESLTATPDHPFFVLDEGERVERQANELEPGDWVYVPDSIPTPAADGGTSQVAETVPVAGDVPVTNHASIEDDAPGQNRTAASNVTQRASDDRMTLDVLPECGELFAEVRESLRLYQSECALNDATYCDFENGRANFSLSKAERVLGRFEKRREQAATDSERLESSASWDTLAEIKDRYHVSQRELAAGTEFSQQQVSARWGEDEKLRQVVRGRLQTVLDDVHGTELSELRDLIRGDVKWRRVTAIEEAEPTVTDDRIPILEHRLADLLGTDQDGAESYARELLETEPTAESWAELREEIERHAISLRHIADRMDVAPSTVSRWSNGVVDGESFETVWPVARDIVQARRNQIRTLLTELDDRREPKVYDLTVEGTHNFLANGMVVHNSEDQSAMHQALEEQSYHPKTEVFTSDGRRVEIGDFVDNRMESNPSEVVDGVDCEILPVEDEGIHTVDLETNEVEKTGIDRVSRHEAPDEFVRVEFSNGREVLVTPDHPMFVADDDIRTIEAQHVEEGAFVPAPRKLPNSPEAVHLEPEQHVGTEKDIDLPERLTPDLGEILGFLVAEGHTRAGSSHEIGFSNQDERLLDRMEQLMSSVFGMESSEHTNAVGTVTKVWVSTKLYRWFESNVPEVMPTAREKRIPAAILGSSEEVIRRFLVGAFAGDGGVESKEMTLSTASAGLAQDYADALLKIGVASRIHHDSSHDSWKVCIMGDSTEQFVEKVVQKADERYETARALVERGNETPRHHDVLPTGAARELRALRKLLGLRLTGRYRPTLDEGYGIRHETVEEELTTLRERIETVRTDIGEADDLAAVRAAIGWSCRELSERLDGVTTSNVNYAEQGGYDTRRRRSLAERARESVRTALDAAERRIENLQQRLELRYYRVTSVETVPNEGEHACDWVYDVTVEPTNTFVGQGVVLHNSISVNKAGINATLKSRCSLLGAANPTMGRFDRYEPIAEQIDLAPPLISRFDLIFTVTDQPDPEEDAELAEHILQTNYAGELNTHRTEVTNSNYSADEVDRVTEEVAPTIEPELLRKYIAFARRTCYPTMTEEAKERIQEFYVDLRAEGAGEDAAVPVTARKLEALVRLAEASARVRLSDTVERADADRAVDIAHYCLKEIGIDPETGELDADVIETGTSKTQRDRVKNILDIVEEIEDEYDDGAPVDVVLDRAEEVGVTPDKAEHEIEKLKQKGEVYAPRTDHLRTT